MKRALICISVFVIVVLFAQCAVKKMHFSKETTTRRGTTTPTAGNTKADTTATKGGAATELADGESIFGQKCGKCHEFHEPGDFKASEWDKVLPKMVQKAKLSDEDAGKVRAWVMAGAKQG
jgi:cytochrome c5